MPLTEKDKYGKSAVQPGNAPKALGAYSPGIVAGGMVYCSGQLGISPHDNQFVLDNGERSVVEETKQAIENLRSILEEANSSLANIVKVTILLANIEDFSAVDAVYRSYFVKEETTPPARACFAVKALPKAALIEMDAVATINA